MTFRAHCTSLPNNSTQPPLPPSPLPLGTKPHVDSRRWRRFLAFLPFLHHPPFLIQHPRFNHVPQHLLFFLLLLLDDDDERNWQPRERLPGTFRNEGSDLKRWYDDSDGRRSTCRTRGHIRLFLLVVFLHAYDNCRYTKLSLFGFDALTSRHSERRFQELPYPRSSAYISRRERANGTGVRGHAGENVKILRR